SASFISCQCTTPVRELPERLDQRAGMLYSTPSALQRTPQHTNRSEYRVTTHAQASRDIASAAIPVRVDIQDYASLAARVAELAQVPTSAPPAAAPRWYALHLAAPALAAPATFDTLLAPRALHHRVQPLPYQLRVVESILRDKAPGAILAD